MENQANKDQQQRQMIHLQVSGEFNQDDLVNLIKKFQETAVEGGVIATPSNVTANVITTAEDLSGLILTPKLSALEVAAIAVEALRGYEIGEGGNSSPTFAELEEAEKVEILNRIQFVLRFGVMPDIQNSHSVLDSIFVKVVRALGTKMMAPKTDDLIRVTRIGQKEGDEDFEIGFLELRQGDVFKHGDNTYVTESDPYVNWIANPLPIITIDAKVYEEPAPVAPEDVKATSAGSKKKVQSKPSKSTAKTRKK
jgi:hypothetical protein